MIWLLRCQAEDEKSYISHPNLPCYAQWCWRFSRPLWQQYLFPTWELAPRCSQKEEHWLGWLRFRSLSEPPWFRASIEHQEANFQQAGAHRNLTIHEPERRDIWAFLLGLLVLDACNQRIHSPVCTIFFSDSSEIILNCSPNIIYPRIITRLLWFLRKISKIRAMDASPEIFGNAGRRSVERRILKSPSHTKTSHD